MDNNIGSLVIVLDKIAKSLDSIAKSLDSDRKEEIEKLSEKQKAFVSTKISDLDLRLGYRLYTRLKDYDIITVDDALDYSPSEFRKIRNLGKKTIQEFLFMVEDYGLEFRMIKHIQ